MRISISSILSNKITPRLIAPAVAFCLVLTCPLTAFATEKEDRIALHQSMPVRSNLIDNWPAGPVVSAASAVLMEMDTGTILYEKNIHDHHYPASTTKILTSLIALERCSLEETVTFSKDAVFGIPRGSNHIAMNVGDTLSMEQCLNAILIRSANEVSYAVAEHIGGSWSGFADIMNERARQLGCVDSNFVNPNGLPDENHYTSAYDLAMIGRAFFANDLLCKITTTPKLVIPKEKEDLIDWNQMDLLPGHKYAYEYLVGCKTGYTNDARSTLVSCAEKDGMKLICVVLKDESPFHYEDTISLFNYGFSNFEKLNISRAETKYNIDDSTLFYSDTDIFASSKPILSLNKQDCVVLPKTLSFEDLTSSISYDTPADNQAALITYSYQGITLGTASVDFATPRTKNHTFDMSDEPVLSPDSDLDSDTENKKGSHLVFINIITVLGIVAAIPLLIFLGFMVRTVLKNYHFSYRPGPVHRQRRSNNSYGSPHFISDRKINAIRRAQIREAKRRYKKRRRR